MKQKELTKTFMMISNQPFQAWIYPCHLHPLQAANCCRNSRLAVDEDDLKCVANEKNSSMKIFDLKPSDVGN